MDIYKIKKMMVVFLSALLGLFILLPTKSAGEKPVLKKGIFEVSGPDWTCWCKDELLYDCFCILER